MKNKPLFYNKKLRDYCINTINKSIKNLPEIYNVKGINTKYKKSPDNDENSKTTKLNFYTFLIFFYISSISGFYLYKRLK